jgi:hypothetical protein
MAMGLEGLPTEFLCQNEGLAVVGFSLIALQGLAPRGDLSEETQDIGLVAAFLVRTSKRQRAPGERVRPFQMARPQLRLPL